MRRLARLIHTVRVVVRSRVFGRNGRTRPNGVMEVRQGGRVQIVWAGRRGLDIHRHHTLRRVE